MKVRTLNYKVSICHNTEKGGVQESLLNEAEKDLNKVLRKLQKDYEIIDVKVNHYVPNRHNNGGCDEVWVQYTILYKLRW